jgi:two-component system cell cycle response regulator
MRDRVLVCESDHKALALLRSFFRRKKNLRVEFMEGISSLRERASQTKEQNLVCIVAVDELAKLNPSKLDSIVFATIPPSSKDGIKKAIKYGVENYLVQPICEEDLEYKIKASLERKKLIDHLKRETDILQAIVELTRLVTSTLDPQEILYLIVKKISEIIPVTRCSIIRVNHTKKRASVVATFENPNLGSMKLDINKYPEIKKALLSRKSVIINDVTADPIMEEVRDIIAPLGIHSIVVIPIMFHEEIIGTLFLRTSRASYAFSEHEIKVCNAIANASANALYNAFLFEKMEDEKSRLEKLSITDYLTGVYNIRYFYHRIKEEFSRSERYNLDLSCLMLDIDRFKGINDKYGHRVGDIILREFAQLLRSHTRKSDVLARYGGEEFIMLLPQTSESGAVAKAETIRACVEKFRFRVLKGKKLLTVSIGAASYPNKGIKNMGDLITTADNALYSAKTVGRNRVVVYRS